MSNLMSVGSSVSGLMSVPKAAPVTVSVSAPLCMSVSAGDAPLSFPPLTSVPATVSTTVDNTVVSTMESTYAHMITTSVTDTTGANHSAAPFKYQNINKLMKKVSRKRVVGQATDECAISSAVRTYDLFVAELSYNTTEEKVNSFLISRDITPVSIEQVSHNRARLKSYKVELTKEHFVKCFDSHIWPRDVVVRKYIPPRTYPELN